MEVQHKSRENGLSEQPVSIVIPRQAEYIGLCRLVAGVVGARGRMNAEDIADLKLAVTEACTCFLWSSEDRIRDLPGDRRDDPSEALSVKFQLLPGAWEVTVSDSEDSKCASGDTEGVVPDPGSLGLTIMRALVDTVEHGHTEGEGGVIRLSKRVAYQAGDIQ